MYKPVWAQALALLKNKIPQWQNIGIVSSLK